MINSTGYKNIIYALPGCDGDIVSEDITMADGNCYASTTGTTFRKDFVLAGSLVNGNSPGTPAPTSSPSSSPTTSSPSASPTTSSAECNSLTCASAFGSSLLATLVITFVSLLV